MIRSFLPKKTPKIAMFGPGLESGTLKIVPLIINNTDMLKTVGVAPGEFTGNNNFFDMSQYSFHNCFQIFLLSDHLIFKASCKFLVYYTSFMFCRGRSRVLPEDSKRAGISVGHIIFCFIKSPKDKTEKTGK